MVFTKMSLIFCHVWASTSKSLITNGYNLSYILAYNLTTILSPNLFLLNTEKFVFYRYSFYRICRLRKLKKYCVVIRQTFFFFPCLFVFLSVYLLALLPDFVAVDSLSLFWFIALKGKVSPRQINSYSI